VLSRIAKTRLKGVLTWNRKNTSKRHINMKSQKEDKKDILIWIEKTRLKDVLTWNLKTCVNSDCKNTTKRYVNTKSQKHRRKSC